MKHLSLFILLAAVAGCNDATRPARGTAAPEQRTGVAERDGQRNTGETGHVDRDNTAVNERDRDGALKTPIDQNENRADIDITAQIRKRVVDTKMSVDAQNVKIITQDGRVTLRGPVKTADEKKQIEDIAHSVAGPDKVDSHLEVAGS